METQVYFSHEGESEIQQFHNILHHIDKRCKLQQSFEAHIRVLAFYNFIQRKDIEVSYAHFRSTTVEKKHNYV